MSDVVSVYAPAGPGRAAVLAWAVARAARRGDRVEDLGPLFAVERSTAGR